jgi:hypothetical protein
LDELSTSCLNLLTINILSVVFLGFSIWFSYLYG